MPYIKKEARHRLLEGTEDAHPMHPLNAGELNFCITHLVQTYLNRVPVNYSAYNAAIGALEAAKLELYRRLVVPYEDGKIRENGDVYDV